MCVLWVRANDHVKPIIGPHDPTRMADLGLYMWSEVGHSGNTLELWCLQYFSLLEIPSGYKTLGQIAWTTTLGVEALRKKVVRLRPSKKSEGEKKKYDDLWFLGPSHGDLYIFSQSFVLDSQKNFNESPHSSKPVAVASPLLWFRLCSRSFQIIVYLQGTNIGTHLFQHHCEWNPLFFLENRVCRPPNTVHQHLGQKCPKSECLLGAAVLMPVPLQACTLPVPGQSCHFVDQRLRNAVSGRYHPGSRSLKMYSLCSL